MCVSVGDRELFCLSKNLKFTFALTKKADPEETVTASDITNDSEMGTGTEVAGEKRKESDSSAEVFE